MKRSSVLLKCVCAFVMFAVAFSVAVHLQKKYDTRNVAYLKKILPDSRHHDFLLTHLEAVSSHIDEYALLLNRARDAFMEHQDITIDIILQTHYAPTDGDKESFNADAIRSQADILKFLQRSSYDVVAYEGCALSTYTFETRVNETLEYAESQGIDTTSEQISADLKGLVQYDAALGYLLECTKRPCQTKFIGSEDPSLSDLHGLLVTVGQWSEEDFGKIQILHETLVTVRSEIAIARTILALAEDGKTKGAVVIGYNHEKSLLAYLNKLQVPGSVFHLE